MPALWSPEDLAARFAPYIEELHDVFAMHGLHYGSPDDIRPLAARLETPGPLGEEVASLVRSMVLREGGSVPRTDLLEVLAIAIAGPRMDAAGEELQQPVRQLLAFLHAALRRPWNEPASEEHLHPEVYSRAEAARELREAAAKLEAEAQNGSQSKAENQVPEQQIEQAAPGPRANVIPFGRARAVFSRLAWEDAELTEAALTEPALMEPELMGRPLGPEEHEAVAPAVQTAQAAQDVAGEAAQIRDAGPVPPLPEAPPAHSNSAPRQPAPVSMATALPQFDDEPPLPAAPQLSRVAIFSGLAAALLVGALLGVTLRAGTGSRSVSARSSDTKVPHPQAAFSAPTGAVPVVSASERPSRGVTQSGARSHFDDDYIAPPYSSMPVQSATSTAASIQPASAISAPFSNSHLPAQQPGELTGSGGPAVGDQSVRAAALAEPPLHPRVPGAVMAMNIIEAPKPDYPMLAKIAHVDGPVVLHAEIGRSGAVVDTEVISGHHLLRHAAEDAVRRWRYHPYQVDGKPVPVSTTITVRFQH